MATPSESSDDKTFIEFIPSGETCHGCGSSDCPHEFKGNQWCDSCLGQKVKHS